METLIIADLDCSQATRAMARARSAHPALRPFWEAGVKLQRGQRVEAPPLPVLKSEPTDLTFAAAQVTGDLAAMETAIRTARARHADLIAFPARAIAETALDQLREAARNHRITVVVGMEHHIAGQRRNSAFVIAPDGELLTRYDQLSATVPFEPGDEPSAMWFRVKGVPAVVTVGEDALWTELAELAAVAGAQVHVHLDHDRADDPDAALRRLQIWSNLASFQTFSVMANVVGSAIWDDLRDPEERRAEVRGLPRPDSRSVEVYSPFSADLVIRAGTTSPLITATRRLGPKNRYHPARTSSFNPQMDAWYRLGAAILCPGEPKGP